MDKEQLLGRPREVDYDWAIPLTLYVRAETASEALLRAVAFERQRKTFDDAGPYAWLHVGLSPETETFTAAIELLEEE